jgi:hypothetical protein
MIPQDYVVPLELAKGQDEGGQSLRGVWVEDAWGLNCMGLGWQVNVGYD